MGCRHQCLYNAQTLCKGCRFKLHPMAQHSQSTYLGLVRCAILLACHRSIQSLARFGRSLDHSRHNACLLYSILCKIVVAEQCPAVLAERVCWYKSPDSSQQKFSKIRICLRFFLAEPERWKNIGPPRLSRKEAGKLKIASPHFTFHNKSIR